MNWLQLLENLGSALIVAVVSTILTVRLALRRFYSEKWWERKSAAYTAILESMHHLREHADTNLAALVSDVGLPSVGEKLLEQNVQSATAELRKQRDVGSFVISQEAVSVLNQLFSDLDKSTETRDWVDNLHLRLRAVDKYLPEVRRIARQDLSLR